MALPWSVTRKGSEGWHFRQGRERRRADRVHDHGKPSVVTNDADHVDHALFAKFAEGSGISGVADTSVAMEFIAKVVDGGLLIGHPGRALARSQCFGNFGTEPVLDRDGDVGVPLRILRPLPRRDENSELAELRRQHGLELQI